MPGNNTNSAKQSVADSTLPSTQPIDRKLLESLVRQRCSYYVDGAERSMASRVICCLKEHYKVPEISDKEAASFYREVLNALGVDTGYIPGVTIKQSAILRNLGLHVGTRAFEFLAVYVKEKQLV